MRTIYNICNSKSCVINCLCHSFAPSLQYVCEFCGLHTYSGKGGIFFTAKAPPNHRTTRWFYNTNKLRRKTEFIWLLSLLILKTIISQCFSAYVDAEHYPERNIVVAKNTVLSSLRQKKRTVKNQKKNRRCDRNSFWEFSPSTYTLLGKAFAC